MVAQGSLLSGLGGASLGSTQALNTAGWQQERLTPPDYSTYTNQYLGQPRGLSGQPMQTISFSSIQATTDPNVDSQFWYYVTQSSGSYIAAAWESVPPIDPDLVLDEGL